MDEQEIPTLEIPDKSVLINLTDEQYQEWKLGLENCYSSFLEGHQQAHQALFDMQKIQENIGA